MTAATPDLAVPPRDFAINGMTCGGCARKVNATLTAIDGVAQAAVTLTPPAAHVTFTRPVAIATLNAALAAAGNYSAREVDTTGDETVPTFTVRAPAETGDSLYPLFLIVGYIAGTGILAAFAFGGTAKFATFMTWFMAGFFLVFSFFKLLDLNGFVSAYRSYDLIAKAWAPWAYLYPFIELALGVAYMLRIAPDVTNAITVALMLLGSVGVLRALSERRQIQCACLGTALKLPMTTVTLVEDLGMAAMAAAMLVTGM